MSLCTKQICRPVALAALWLILLVSPSQAATFSPDILQSREFLMGLGGVGAVLMVMTFFLFTRRGKSKEVLAYEAELERFRRSIRQ